MLRPSRARPTRRPTHGTEFSQCASCVQQTETSTTCRRRERRPSEHPSARGTGPFPAILDVHERSLGCAKDVRRDEHTLMAQALAADGIVSFSIDYRQMPRTTTPDSVADVKFRGPMASRQVESKFNPRQKLCGVFGSSSGGHLVFAHAMRPSDPRYAAAAVARAESAILTTSSSSIRFSDPLCSKGVCPGTRQQCSGEIHGDIYFFAVWKPPGGQSLNSFGPRRVGQTTARPGRAAGERGHEWAW